MPQIKNISADTQGRRLPRERDNFPSSRRRVVKTKRPWKHASLPLNARYSNRSIRVTDGFPNKDALLLVLDQHERHLLEKMTFCLRPKSLDPAASLAEYPKLSTAARELLSGKLAPNINRIDLQCDFDVETGLTERFERGVSGVFQQPKDEDALLQLELDDPRRRLLADAWSALAHNTTVRELSIDRFVPLWTSSFHSAVFRQFLGRLERLDINIFGLKNGHRGINTVPAYIDSLQSILKIFFLNATAVKRLTLNASQHALLSARGPYHIPLALKATRLPELRHLTLKNCFIGFELAHFINGHVKTLETLELHNCYSYRGAGDDDATGGMGWAQFLAMITRSEMRLRRLDMYNDHIPLTIDDSRLKTYDADTADEPEDVKNVRRTQRKKPKMRLFLYAYLRNYSGELWINKDAILASFDAGDDQGAFDELMKVVQRNARAVKGAVRTTTTTTTTRPQLDKCRMVKTVRFAELPA